MPSPIINPTTFPASRFANINILLGILIPLAFIIAGLIFGSMLIVVAYTILTAAGDQEKIQKAQNTATFAVIGIVVVVVAALLVRLLGFITGIPIPFL